MVIIVAIIIVGSVKQSKRYNARTKDPIVSRFSCANKSRKQQKQQEETYLYSTSWFRKNLKQRLDTVRHDGWIPFVKNNSKQQKTTTITITLSTTKGYSRNHEKTKKDATNSCTPNSCCNNGCSCVFSLLFYSCRAAAPCGVWCAPWRGAAPSYSRCFCGLLLPLCSKRLVNVKRRQTLAETSHQCETNRDANRWI